MALSLGLGCRTEPRSAEAPTPTARSYTVDGEVIRLNAPGSEPREILLRHQAIPDFVGIDGEVVGMKGMSMSFPLDPAVSAEDLAQGDPIRFTFTMDWQGSPPYEITAIERLDETDEVERPASASENDRSP